MQKPVTALSLSLLILLSACSPQPRSQQALEANNNPSVIWDEDSREDISTTDKTAPLAQATASLIRSFRLTADKDGNFTYEARTLKSSYPLCADEKFTNQNILGHCSGVLIGPRTVLTAGHCIKDEKSCAETKLTFARTEEKSANLKLNGDEVYNCTKILKYEENALRDYAVIELDRDVTQAKPVKMGQADGLQVHEEVLNLSYPLGLPLKKDLGTIKDNTAGGFYLRARVDTFAGSSGSPLFNKQNELVAILVSGTEDFDDDEIYRIQMEKNQGDCINVKRCKDSSCLGERFLKLEGIELP